MKKYILPLISILIASASFVFISWQKSLVINPDTRVNELLASWEGKHKSHIILNVDVNKAKLGKELSTKGWTTVDGKKTKVISKYFVCTDCHNNVIEEEDIANPNPEGRLRKAVKENIPFLQGTTFYGAVNRESWYNQDYVKKYGGLVAPAKDTLENAIQLCAKVCSSGRYLEGWELEAILHYYNTIDYKLKDLNLNASDWEKLESTEINTAEKVAFVKSKYALLSPATFLDPIEKNVRVLGAKGNLQRGKEIYIQSCMACHGLEKEMTSFKLDTTYMSLNFLKNFIPKKHPYSIYEIVRKGTMAEFAIKAYMPHYTAERMSDQQLEDLVAYIMH
jgi:mono/diheme cytochrome c family protein